MEMEDVLLDNRPAVQRYVTTNANITAQELRLILSFQGRYKLARNFKCIVVEGYRERTLVSYNLGFQLFLTYTALERLSKIVRKHHHMVEINNPKVAQSLRSVYVTQQNAIRTVLAKTQFAQSFDDFMSGKTDNIRIMATALRMLVFAGHFSFSSTSTLMPLHIRALQDLNEAILKYCVQTFETWFKKRKKGEVPPPEPAAENKTDDEDDLAEDDASPLTIIMEQGDLTETDATSKSLQEKDLTQTQVRRRHLFGF